MNKSPPPLPDLPPAIRVAAGEDRFGEHRGLGISVIEFKVVPQDSSGLFISRTASMLRVRPGAPLALRARRVVLRGGRRVPH